MTMLSVSTQAFHCLLITRTEALLCRRSIRPRSRLSNRGRFPGEDRVRTISHLHLLVWTFLQACTAIIRFYSCNLRIQCHHHTLFHPHPPSQPITQPHDDDHQRHHRQQRRSAPGGPRKRPGSKGRGRSLRPQSRNPRSLRRCL